MLEPVESWSNEISADDVTLLRRIEGGMPLLADVSRADVSLLVKDGEDAVIVTQAQPHSIASVYRQLWVGRRLPLADQPLLTAGLVEGRSGQRQLKLLEQGATIVQQVFPVVSGTTTLPVVLQIETSLIAWERQKRRHESFRQAVGWLQNMVLRGELVDAASLPRFTEWDGVLFVDSDYRILYLSGVANNLYRRLGYLDKLSGRHIGDLQTHDEVLIRRAFETRLCQQHQVKEGSLTWTRMVVPVWDYPSPWWAPERLASVVRLPHNRYRAPVLRGALVMVHDNTEQLRKAEELMVLQTIVKEVHHRVKNNLQSVASMLRMQARRAQNEETRLQLQEAVNRVLAVSVIHEFLSSHDQQTINIYDVCQRIITQTQRAAIYADKIIDMRLAGPPIRLPSQQATVCSLVVNELLLNALEHAFTDRDSGSVAITLADNGECVTLVVADDGTGLPPGFDPTAVESLGLSIVRTLVEGDLRGQFDLEPGNPGTRAIVSFKKGNPSEE